MRMVRHAFAAQQSPIVERDQGFIPAQRHPRTLALKLPERFPLLLLVMLLLP